MRQPSGSTAQISTPHLPSPRREIMAFTGASFEQDAAWADFATGLRRGGWPRCGGRHYIAVSAFYYFLASRPTARLYSHLHRHGVGGGSGVPGSGFYGILGRLLRCQRPHESFRCAGFGPPRAGKPGPRALCPAGGHRALALKENSA